MDIRQALLQDRSKEHIQRLMKYIGDDQERFDRLIALFFTADKEMIQRSSWLMSDCCMQHPFLIDKHLKKLLDYLQPDSHVAIKRNTVRILQVCALPEDLLGEIADKCFSFLENTQESIAVRVFSMTVLERIVDQVPELAPELCFIIEAGLPYEGPAFLSRGKKILHRLKQLR